MFRTIAGLALAVILAACAGPSSGALGLVAAPVNLDPASPSIASIELAFDKVEVAVPAGRDFILVYENREDLPHNVSIYRDAGFKERVFEGLVFNGPATRWYPVPALAPGTYFFQCDVHPIPMMQGTISAGL